MINFNYTPMISDREEGGGRSDDSTYLGKQNFHAPVPLYIIPNHNLFKINERFWLLFTAMQ